jgi:TolB-like protein/methylphosphotriester-DNA--protein-cysteine methyltransferase
MSRETEYLRDHLSEFSPGRRLDSWKEIAAYLKCSERTVRRWEQEGLPVHRHAHKKKAGIYAYKGEIDAWWRNGHEQLNQVEAQPAGKWSRSRIVTALGLAVLLIALTVVTVRRLRDRFFSQTRPVSIQSVAVLPLENLSHDPEQEYFADGMTDALITDLAKIHALRVISRNSIMQYKGNRKPMPQIARELHVDAVVEGTVMRSGDRVRITAQLIEAPSDRHLWAETYERDSRDILALQDEVARTIAGEIKVTLTPEERSHLSNARQVNPAANEAYLRGYNELRRHQPATLYIAGEAESIAKAIHYFQQAIAIDPKDALAYAGLADAYYDQSTFLRAPLEVMPKAKAAAVRALELDETLAEAHASLGNVKVTFDWDWSGAEREFRRALELNPNLPQAHAGYARYFLALRRMGEAIQEIDRMQELDPLFPQSHMAMPLLLFQARRYENAVQAARASGDDRALALSLAELGRKEEAAAAADRAVRLEQNPMVLAQVASAYALAGKSPTARAMLTTIEAQARERYICGYNVACIYATLGDKERAFSWLEKGYRARSD